MWVWNKEQNCILAKKTFCRYAWRCALSSVRTILRVLNCCVWTSVLMCGCETWTVSKSIKESMMAGCSMNVVFMLNVELSWKDRVTNEEVLKMADTERELYKARVRRQLMLCGPGMREKGLGKKTLMDLMNGKKRQGRQDKNIRMVH